MKSEIRSLFRFCCNLIDSPALILLYHRVTNISSDPQLLAVKPENFNDHLNFIKKKFHLVNLDEFASCIIHKRKLPKRSVVITFDDGYADNFLEALPILESHGAQALFYISTSNLDTSNEFWWDNLERVFLLDHSLPSELKFKVSHQVRSFRTATRHDRINTYNSLHPIVKNCPTTQRDELMNTIIDWSGLSQRGRDTHRLMTSSELLSLAGSSSAVIGAHTHTHPKLSVCSTDDQRRDISQSKSILENLLRKEIHHFSYPFGSKLDYSPQTVEICRQLGFKIVSANYHGQLHSWHSPFELPRVLVRDWTEEDFGNKMHTFFNY